MSGCLLCGRAESNACILCGSCVQKMMSRGGVIIEEQIKQGNLDAAEELCNLFGGEIKSYVKRIGIKEDGDGRANDETAGLVAGLGRRPKRAIRARIREMQKHDGSAQERPGAALRAGYKTGQGVSARRGHGLVKKSAGGQR